MSKEVKIVAGTLAALIGMAISLSGHWIVGDLLSLAGVVLIIVSLAKAKD
jgi:hypothetical protein